MQSSNKRKVKKLVKAGRTAGDVFILILKIFGTLFLIGLTTALIFACIFTIYIKTNLTSELDMSLDDFSQNLSSVIYYTDSETGEYQELVTLQSKERRTWVYYENIPKNMEHAVVAIEDKRFYVHNGVDWYRTAGAFVNMFIGMKDTFGGSTITQQLIKNLTGYDDVTVQRKLLEIFRALEFEKNYSKEQILEWYLNVVYFGHGCYGIGSAADYYYGKDVSELTLAECAALIGITNNPSLFSPFISVDNNKERQLDVLFEMYDKKYITEEVYNAAINETLVFQRGEDEEAETVIYTWFEDAIIEDVIGDLMVVKDCSYQIAQQLLFTGGYKIYSTIDVDIQEKVDSIYENLDEIPKTTGSEQQLQSSIVIIDPYTGNIVAMSGGVGEKTGNRLFNMATQSERPPGSSIKPIAVYAPAMDLGLITPDTRFKDDEDVTLTGTTWMPYNDNRAYNGVVTVREALRRSINTISAQILDLLTPAVSFNFMVDKLHFTTLDVYDADYAPLSLGQLTYGATVREMATAYSIFPNQGVYTSSSTYTHITDTDDNMIFDNNPTTNVAISEVTAYWITNLLQEAATSGTGYEARLSNMATAGKTGTTSDKKDRWFCGFTPYYVAAVWTGYEIPEVIRVSGNPAAQLWKKVMTLIHEDLENKSFTVPSNTYLPPVPGVDEEVDYIVRGVSESGVVLYEVTDNDSPGDEVTVTASEVEGYTIIGVTEKTFIVSDIPEENIIEFIYKEDIPEVTDEPVTPTPDDTPPPTDHPSTPSHDPSPTPSPSPSP